MSVDIEVGAGADDEASYMPFDVNDDEAACTDVGAFAVGACYAMSTTKATSSADTQVDHEEGVRKATKEDGVVVGSRRWR